MAEEAISVLGYLFHKTAIEYDFSCLMFGIDLIMDSFLRLSLEALP